MLIRLLLIYVVYLCLEKLIIIIQIETLSIKEGLMQIESTFRFLRF